MSEPIQLKKMVKLFIALQITCLQVRLSMDELNPSVAIPHTVVVKCQRIEAPANEEQNKSNKRFRTNFKFSSPASVVAKEAKI